MLINHSITTINHVATYYLLMINLLQRPQKKTELIIQPVQDHHSMIKLLVILMKRWRLMKLL